MNCRFRVLLRLSVFNKGNTVFETAGFTSYVWSLESAVGFVAALDVHCLLAEARPFPPVHFKGNLGDAQGAASLASGAPELGGGSRPARLLWVSRGSARASYPTLRVRSGGLHMAASDHRSGGNADWGACSPRP